MERQDTPGQVPDDLNWRGPWAERGAEVSTEDMGPGWDARAAELAQAGSLDPEKL